MSVNQNIIGIAIIVVVILLGILTDRDGTDRRSIDVWGQDHSLDDE